MILMEEQQRANRYPISQKANKSLHRIFDGIDQRIQLLSAPSTGNAMLHDGIKRMKQCLQQYRILLQDLEEEEAEFMTLYPIYEKVQTELGQPVKKVMDFSGLEELRVALEDSKQSVARAERCAKLYRELGKDAYVCLAFDTEMRALGYSVVERQKILQSMDENLEKHTCANGMQIPVYDLPGQDAVTQVYKIDESCQIQVILHADGTTTMQTIMTGSNANATVAAQRKHCERLAELSQSVRKNWFILCDMIESEPPEKTSRSMIGTRENNGERNNHADGKKFERHQYL
ncbi:MAG TPA: hypothetical protein DCZ91_01635 [Lachnospiraceae bacterium]|nr:hypothetical protein [Lachnospiraceae bacterium]